jgi:hypothetical protein
VSGYGTEKLCGMEFEVQRHQNYIWSTVGYLWQSYNSNVWRRPAAKVPAFLNG